MAQTSKNRATTKAAAKTTEKAEKKTTERSAEQSVMVDNRDAEIELLKQQIEELKRQASQPQVITVNADTEKVHLLWQAEVADDNEYVLGDNGMFGRITGKYGEVYVPKSDFSRILNPMTREFLRRRWLLVLDGLNDLERESLGVNYKDEELLDRAAFARLLDMKDALVSLYTKLCEGHREIVQKRYYEAWKSGDKRVIRSVVTDLHNAAKSIGEENDTFGVILNEMNEKDAN